MTLDRNPNGYDGYLVHEGDRYPLGMHPSQESLLSTVRNIQSKGGAFTHNTAGVGIFVPIRQISRYLLVPRTP